MGTIVEQTINVEPFEISVSEDVLIDLKERLENTRWLSPHKDNDWDYGTSVDYLKEFVDYWNNTYDWQKHQQEMNSFNHYKAAIEDYKIHFIYERGEGNDPIPLLLLHGWPDSFYRFHKIIPLLTDVSSGESFDVVVPSLPGFGFTECPIDRTEDKSLLHVSELLWKLMTDTLGYERFAVAGGDGGSPIAQLLALHHPESVMAIYITDIGWQASTADPSTLSKKEQHYQQAALKSFMKEGAYAMVQTTKPQTLAYSLSDSPVGLASWILDRFHFWCDGNGDIENSFSKDEILTNIMIYWVTGTIGSSMRNYRLETKSSSLPMKYYINLPVGLGLFPKDIGGVPPQEFAGRSLNVQHWKEMPRGGHFTAWEEPELMANDMREFFPRFYRLS